MRERRLLVVEDDVDIREVLAEDLEYRGYTVDTAENGVDALAALRRNGSPHELVVLDLMMPVMDGWELLREMRADERLRCVPQRDRSAFVDRQPIVGLQQLAEQGRLPGIHAERRALGASQCARRGVVRCDCAGGGAHGLGGRGRGLRVCLALTPGVRRHRSF